ncbi:MAG: hypothetical protein ACYS8W_05065 [Planctomycetota bacterium]|jgi:hypothetical protein
MVMPLAENAFYFHGITSPGNSPNAPQVAQSTQAVPVTADRVEISNAAEDSLRAVTGTPGTTESPEEKSSTAESASRMPAQTSGAGGQSPANEARERQIMNIAAVYKIDGGSEDQLQSNVIESSSGDVAYTNPIDRTVALHDQQSAVVGEIFDTMM